MGNWFEVSVFFSQCTALAEKLQEELMASVQELSKVRMMDLEIISISPTFYSAKRCSHLWEHPSKKKWTFSMLGINHYSFYWQQFVNEDYSERKLRYIGV